MSRSQNVISLPLGPQYPVVRTSISTSTKSVAMMKVCSDCNPRDGKTKSISLNQVHQILSYTLCLLTPPSITHHRVLLQYLEPRWITCPGQVSSQYLELMSIRSPSSSCPRHPWPLNITHRRILLQYLESKSTTPPSLTCPSVTHCRYCYNT